ncbi:MULTISPECIES: DMT family transporter [unclassified Ochrobactrum]|uniref:DMT family transporter n=1 Tax=unclassified Ochrobactrum TaxID=239106 RepID=UPI000DEF1808|nr:MULTISPECIES: DMT family transporter [unclassified Ochrobactrum]
MRRIALLAFAINPILWASFYTVAKPGIVETDPLLFSTLELLWTVPVGVLILACLLRRITLRNLLRGMIAGTSLYAVVLLSAAALYLTTATETAIFPALNGLLAVAFAWLFLGGEADRKTWLVGIVAAIGVLSVLPAFGNRFAGNFIALLGAVAYTSYIYVAERVTRDSDADVWTIFASELLTMAAYGSILVLVIGSGRLLLNQAPSMYWTTCYVGIGTTVIPTAISIIFQRYVPPVTTAFLYTLEPIWSAALAAGVLGEHLSVRSYLGGLAILLSAALHSLPLSSFPLVSSKKDSQ